MARSHEISIAPPSTSELPQPYVDEAFEQIRANNPDLDIYSPEPDNETSALPDVIVEGGQLETIDDETLRAAAPELESSPQIAWTEASIADTPTDAEYNLRLNFRLTRIGLFLDAAAKSVDSDGDARAWLKLKRRVSDAKAMGSGERGKVSEVIDIESDAYDFIVSRDVDTASVEYKIATAM